MKESYKKFQEQSNSLQVIYFGGSKISWSQGYSPGPKNGRLLLDDRLAEFFVTKECDISFGNPED